MKIDPDKVMISAFAIAAFLVFSLFMMETFAIYRESPEVFVLDTSKGEWVCSEEVQYIFHPDGTMTTEVLGETCYNDGGRSQ